MATPPKKQRGSRRKPVATTRSTAGPGFDFEDLVAADLLSRSIADRPLPGIDVPARELLSQADALGWRLDDLVAIGVGPDGAERRLAISCKSNVQVSANGFPADFAQRVWAQWTAGQPFDRDRDHLALATRDHNAAFNEIWANLKTWVGSEPGPLALARINASTKAKRVFDSLCARAPTGMGDADTLALIRHLHILPTDFQLEPSSALEQAVGRLRPLLVSQAEAEARDLWQALVGSAREARLSHGCTSVERLWQGLREHIAFVDHPGVAAAWARLVSLSTDHRDIIETRLPSGHVIDRADKGTAIIQALAGGGPCLVVGESGVGKSALVKAALDARLPNWQQVWLGPGDLAAALAETQRGKIGLTHSLVDILALAPAPRNILVIDAAERLDAATIARLRLLITTLENRLAGWSLIVVSQSGALDAALRPLLDAAAFTRVAIDELDEDEVGEALASAPTLAWMAGDPAMVPLLTNLRALAWVIESAPAFAQMRVPAEPTAIADRLWRHWTNDSLVLERLLMRLAEREADFVRSFPISELDAADAQVLDPIPKTTPLLRNRYNAVEFQHDLAADWARYQRLKEIGRDTGRWAALASHPLWIPALRLHGQFLLADGAAFDEAFARVREDANTAAADLLLDAISLHPSADRHLAARRDLLFANDGALLTRLLSRFLQVATIPQATTGLAADPGLRIYLEAEMRSPVFGRWPPIIRFLAGHHDDVVQLMSPIVAKLCLLWLRSTPPRLEDGTPTPYRLALGRIALATAQAWQVQDLAHGWARIGGDGAKMVYSAALEAAADLPEEVGAFALEMAERRVPAAPTLEKVAALKARLRAERAARASAAKPRPIAEPVFVSSRRPLPPWPLGPAARLDDAFRAIVLHAGGMKGLMATHPPIAAEVILACIIEDEPVEEGGRSRRLDDLGLHWDRESYPTIFWKSPFFLFLQLNPEPALSALLALVDFAMSRWAAPAPPGTSLPAIDVPLQSGPKRFIGNFDVFDWAETSSTHAGQLHCGLSALERWLILKADAGADISPFCERLLDSGASAAILGVLVNVGKHRPELFNGPLAPLLETQELYWWDDARVDHGHLRFDAFTWSRAGEAAARVAHDIIRAPHRQARLRHVAGELAAAVPEVARRLAAAAACWPDYEHEKSSLELAILKADLDPANRVAAKDGSTQIAHPPELQQAVLDYNHRIRASLATMTLPYECEQALAVGGELTDESAARLASELSPAGQLPETPEGITIAAAAAATLITLGSDWLSRHPPIEERAQMLIKEVVAASGETLAEQRAPGSRVPSDALRFAATGAMTALVGGSAPDSWDRTILHLLTSHDPAATARLMTIAFRHRAILGARWWRLHEVALLAAGLDELAPRYEVSQDAEARWNRWLARLRGLSLGRSATFADIDPVGLAQRVERLSRLIWQHRPLSPWHRSRGVPDRVSQGLSWPLVNAAFVWLLSTTAPIDSSEAGERLELVRRLWAFEAWRLEGQKRDDHELGVPSDLGFKLLEQAPQIITLVDVETARPLWQDIFDLGAAGHYALEHFLSMWFNEPARGTPADGFLAHWRVMLDYGLGAGWASGRKWFHGRRLRAQLLGLRAASQLEAAPSLMTRLPKLESYYETWARTDLADDEEALATFGSFLSMPGGRFLRLKGLIWMRDALAAGSPLREKSAGHAICEAINAALVEQTEELLSNTASREAAIEIVSIMVSKQVTLAIGLQQRLAAIR